MIGMAMEQAEQVQQSADVVARDVGGEAVLLHLVQGTYYGLNPAGSRIWDFLNGQPRTLDEICAMLVREYAVEEAEARADAVALLADLRANGLVEQA